jgi:hypothetical protein
MDACIVAISEGQSHFLKGCPSKDLRISIVVPPTDVGYNDHIRKCIDLIWKCPYF